MPSNKTPYPLADVSKLRQKYEDSNFREKISDLQEIYSNNYSNIDINRTMKEDISFMTKRKSEIDDQVKLVDQLYENMQWKRKKDDEYKQYQELVTNTEYSDLEDKLMHIMSMYDKMSE